MFRWGLVCLISFLVAMQIVPLDYIMLDDLATDSALSTVA